MRLFCRLREQQVAIELIPDYDELVPRLARLAIAVSWCAAMTPAAAAGAVFVPQARVHPGG